MNIIHHIQYLLIHHQCVIVPSLGAFVVQRTQAEASSDGTQMLPPSRTVAFNASLNHDDALLVGSVARREGVSYEAAQQMVQNQVEMLSQRLDMDSVVEFNRIGKLYKQAEAIVFEPDPHSIANAAYSQLQAVALPKEAWHTQQAADEAHLDAVAAFNATLSSKLSMPHILRPALKYAAAVALLIAVGATLSTPIMVDNQSISRASITLPSVTSAKSVTLPAVNENSAAEAVKPFQAPKAEFVTLVSDIDKATADEANHYVIVASCSSEAQAQRYIAENGGPSELAVINCDGRYRVYAAVSRSYEAAYLFKQHNPEFAAAHPTAWVYSK